MFVVVVLDMDLEKVIDIFMVINSKGKSVDGKIFWGSRTYSKNRRGY
jgi:nitrogen regulatory protein PII